MPPSQKRKEEGSPDYGISQVAMDTPSAKMWPITNILLAAGMGSSIIVAFHIVKLTVSLIRVSELRVYSWILFPAICVASFLGGMISAFVLRNLEGRVMERGVNAFTGAICGLFGSAIGIFITIAIDVYNNINATTDVLVIAVISSIMLGGLLSIGSAIFAAAGALMFVFLVRR
ncbi:MAG: hypothetical protein QXW70_00300 [Candidatus Anstonellales archaeon]